MGRKNILLIIFIFLALFALVFGAAYNGYMGKKLQEYIIQLARCSYLNEAQCIANPNCKPVFKPTGEGKSIDFEACKYKLVEEKVEMKSLRKLCEDTGGVWESIRLGGEYCNCKVHGSTKNYKPNEGCVE